jgi:hypothetical protein
LVASGYHPIERNVGKATDIPPTLHRQKPPVKPYSDWVPEKMSAMSVGGKSLYFLGV